MPMLPVWNSDIPKTEDITTISENEISRRIGEMNGWSAYYESLISGLEYELELAEIAYTMKFSASFVANTGSVKVREHAATLECKEELLSVAAAKRSVRTVKGYISSIEKLVFPLSRELSRRSAKGISF